MATDRGSGPVEAAPEGGVVSEVGRTGEGREPNNDTAPTPYYQDEAVTLYCGDALDILPTLTDASADLVLTDPPYNCGVDYGPAVDDSLPSDIYTRWCGEWFAECERVAGRVIIFPGHGNLPTWWAIRKPSGVGCWYKPGNPGSAGIFQFCEWEPFLLYGGRRLGTSDVVRETVNRQMDTGNHPCPKPLGLMKQLLVKTKATSMTDPFAGSGSTLVAAKYLGVTATGIEINEAYCEHIAKRLAQDVLDFGAAS